MKTLLLNLIFLSLPLQAAVKFSLERSTPMGSDKLEVNEENGKVAINKTSNWFDKKPDHRLGSFVPKDPSAFKTITAEIAKIEEQLKAADEKLATYGTGFNELNDNSEPHAPYFRVNGFKVKKTSILYPRLQELANKIQTTQLTLINGVELDSARKNYVFYQDGKEVNREDFNARFFCELPRFPTRCLARKWGALYLE